MFYYSACGLGEFAGRGILRALVNRPQHGAATPIHHEEVALAAAYSAGPNGGPAKIHIPESTLSSLWVGNGAFAHIEVGACVRSGLGCFWRCLRRSGRGI